MTFFDRFKLWCGSLLAFATRYTVPIIICAALVVLVILGFQKAC